MFEISSFLFFLGQWITGYRIQGGAKRQACKVTPPALRSTADLHVVAEANACNRHLLTMRVKPICKFFLTKVTGP